MLSHRIILTTSLYDGFLSSPVINGSIQIIINTKCIINAVMRFLWTDSRQHCMDLQDEFKRCEINNNHISAAIYVNIMIFIRWITYLNVTNM